ncbi:MAG TPA: bifunctional 2-polyprenyl-6-hydroxyphenol methylase/3-demethylubiquinol 3-O-methyltransferase UbiG [Aestuariivirga sp.]|nr:bifunctional 2-polyprenyl-6-hydroxyphenol methylase/3-demethylubiquinol 3-O-methyltransferase UbiG [Aestuariivirga sp.]
MVEAPSSKRRIARPVVALLYGLSCHGLFIAGVGMMMWQMYFGMSRSFGTLAYPWNWFGNGFLLLQFPLAHSFLLARPGRSVLKRLAPAAFSADLSVTTYVIVASLQVLLLFSLWTFSGVIWWRADGLTRWALSILYGASWLLLGKAIVDAGITLQTGSLGWWAVFKNARPQYPGMPARGLFRLCRQPIYLAFALTLWTVPLWTPDQLVIAIVLTAYCLIGPLFKEARFTRAFGQSFLDYKTRHPYWLPVPRRLPRAERNDLSIYDRYAGHWWDGSKRWLRTLQNLVPARLKYFDRIAEWPGKNVLDLGCGGGFMSEALARRGAIVTGVDPAGAAIAIAARHAASQHLPVRYLVAAGESLPLPSQSMDYVVCVDVLEHVGDVGTVLNEVARVLRPGGLFLFDTINRTRLAVFVMIFLGERVLRLLPRGTHDPAKLITPNELEALLMARGFGRCIFAGLGPIGLNRKLDFVFGQLPTLSIMYMSFSRRGEKA